MCLINLSYKRLVRNWIPFLIVICYSKESCHGLFTKFLIESSFVENLPFRTCSFFDDIISTILLSSFDLGSQSQSIIQIYFFLYYWTSLLFDFKFQNVFDFLKAEEIMMKISHFGFEYCIRCLLAFYFGYFIIILLF